MRQRLERPPRRTRSHAVRRFAVRILGIVFASGMAWSLAVTAAMAAANPAATYGAAWNPAIGQWLPDPQTGFDAWSKRQAMVVRGYDYFVCGSNAKPSLPPHDFAYAGSVCAPLKNGTAFVFGTAEPIKGSVVYDRAHSIVLFYKGCCAWRGFALTANVAPPPKPVSNADLTGVHTMRGVALGMTQKQLAHMYGAAAPHAAKGRPGLTTISYTTFRGGPNDGSTEPCGQIQSFTFKADKLISIELLSGC